MSVDMPKQNDLPPPNGNLHDESLSPLHADFEKLKIELGFMSPEGAEDVLAGYLDADEETFSHKIRQYVDLYVEQCHPQQADNWDVYEFRGILVSIAQLYHERYSRAGVPHDATYRARMHECKHYLRTVDEDLFWHEEPANPHLDRLLLGLKVDLPNLPKPKPVRFTTNIMRILSRIDPNIAALYLTQNKTAP